MKNTTKQKHIAKLSTKEIESWLQIKSIPEQTRRLMIEEMRDRKLKELGI